MIQHQSLDSHAKQVNEVNMKSAMLRASLCLIFVAIATDCSFRIRRIRREIGK